MEAQKAAYMETCIEDDEIGERMDAGPQRPCWNAATTKSALPEPHGRRHAALSRVVPPDHGQRGASTLSPRRVGNPATKANRSNTAVNHRQ